MSKIGPYEEKMLEPRNHKQEEMLDLLRARVRDYKREVACLKEAIRDSETWCDDFCIVCDNHISNGHGEECPMQIGGWK